MSNDLKEFGRNLAALGRALQDEDSNMDELALLAHNCGLRLHIGLSQADTSDDERPAPGAETEGR